MKSVLLSIQSLLAEPNPDDPLNNEAAAEWKSNKKAAENKAKEYVKLYAKWSVQTWTYIHPFYHNTTYHSLIRYGFIFSSAIIYPCLCQFKINIHNSQSIASNR